MRRLLAILAALSLAGPVAGTPDPTVRCQAAGYDTAIHLLQRDGVTREWTCFRDGDFPAVPAHKPLKEI